MRLIRAGDTGERVRDVQQRLAALKYPIPSDERGGTFGDGTRSAVMGFQQTRGLLVDGIVGDDTWRELVEASWSLGDRVLYLRAPNLRGDDVRDLQDRLGTLGFNVGRVDGIFGPATQTSVREFQRNYGIDDDGIVADTTIRAIKGLPQLSGNTPSGALREREALRRRPRSLAGLRIALDPGHGPEAPGNVGPAGVREDEWCYRLAHRLDAAFAAAGAHVFLTRAEDATPTERERARLANALEADVFLSLHLGGGPASARGAAAFYFGHERFHSAAGLALAEMLLEQICGLGLIDARTHTKTFPVLRETRMPAVVLEPGYVTNPDEESLLAGEDFQAALAIAILESLARFVRAPAAP